MVSIEILNCLIKCLYRWFIIVFNCIAIGGIHEQVEPKDESNTNTLSFTDGIPWLLQLLFQRISLWYWCIKLWIFLRAWFSRIELCHIGSIESKQQYDQEQFLNSWNYKELQKSFQSVEKLIDLVSTAIECQHNR